MQKIRKKPSVQFVENLQFAIVK